MIQLFVFKSNKPFRIIVRAAQETEAKEVLANYLQECGLSNDHWQLEQIAGQTSTNIFTIANI